MWLLELIEGCIAFLIGGVTILGAFTIYYFLVILCRRIARALDR